MRTADQIIELTETKGLDRGFIAAQTYSDAFPGSAESLQAAEYRKALAIYDERRPAVSGKTEGDREMNGKQKIEEYINDNELEGTKTADVLRDYGRGHTTLGDICWFYGFSIDTAVSHLKKIGLVA